MFFDPMKSGAIRTVGPRMILTGGDETVRQLSQAQPTADEFGQGDGDADGRVWRPAPGGAAGTTPSGLSAERLREILVRLTSGYYDTARVQDRVAERVQGVLVATRHPAPGGSSRRR